MRLENIDEENILDSICVVLKMAGCGIETAKSGKEGML